MIKRYPSAFTLWTMLLSILLCIVGVVVSKEAQISSYRVTTEVGGLNSRAIVVPSDDSLTGSVEVPISYHQTVNPKQVACGIDGEMYILDDQAIRIINITDCNPRPTDIVHRYVQAFSSTQYYLEGYRLDVILGNPFQFAVHPITGDLYVPQYSRHNIFKVSKETGMVKSIFGTNGTPGTSLTMLNSPKGFCFDPITQAMVVADSGNSRILRIFPNGTSSWEAGTVSGNTNDNVSAKTATISNLMGVVALSSGDIYYSESGKIRKVSNGIVSTLVTAPGILGYISLSTDEKSIFYSVNDNKVYSVNLLNKATTLIAGATTTGVIAGDGGLAIDASLKNPSHVFMNKYGDLYISCMNSVIRKVFTNGTITTAFGFPTGYKFSGNGFSKEVVPVFGRPLIALNQTSGELHFFDGSRMLRKVSSDGIVRKVIGVMIGSAEDSAATLVKNGPVDPDNNKFDSLPSNMVVIGDAYYFYNLGKIQKLENYYYSNFLDLSAYKVLNTSYCPNKPTTLIRFNESENCIYYVYQSKSIVVYNITSGKSTAIVNPQGYVGAQSTLTHKSLATFSEIKLATMNSLGEVFIFDVGSNIYIKKLQLDGYVSVYAGSTAGDVVDVTATSAKFADYIKAMVYNEKTNELIIADSTNFKIKKISGGYARLVAGGGSSILTNANIAATTAKLGTIVAMAVTDNSEIIFADGKTTASGYLLKIVYPNGTLSFVETSFSTGLIQCISAKSINEIYISSSTVIVKLTNLVTLTTMAGNKLESIGFEVGDPVKGDGGYALQNRINPKTIDVSSTGDIYMHDFGPGNAYYSRIRKVSTNGNISTLIGYDTGPLCKVTDTISTYYNSIKKGDNGGIYACDSTANVNRIVRLDTYTGNINTVVGAGGSTYIGEGYPRMVNVVPLVSYYLESTGELYFAESNRVRKINSNGMTELVAGTGSASFSVSTTGTKATTTPIGVVTSIIAYKTSVITYVYIFSSNRISVVKNGQIYLIAGNSLTTWYSQQYYYAAEGTNALDAHFDTSTQLEISASGEIYTSELGRIRKLAPYCEDKYYLEADSFLCYWYCYGDLMNSTTACSSRGSCESPDVCSCDSGFAGDHCENIECIYGWYGADCNITSCDGVMSDDTATCTGHGNCYDVDTCNCSTGYTGQFCESFSCYGIASTSPITCLGHGACVGYNQCNCYGGYYGNQCDIFSCFSVRKDNSSVCSGHGNCIGMDNCQCNSGYYGGNCNITSCFGILENNVKVCSGNGTCVSNDTCNCNSGYTGAYCNTTLCYGIAETDPKVCSGNGVCHNQQCSCYDGFFSSNCSIGSCFGIRQDNSSVCSSNGNCTSKDVCACNSGYFGERCNITSCFGIRQDNISVCSSNGTCIALDQCSCNRGYYGNQCEIISCFSMRQDNTGVCSGNGSCIGMDTCQCNGGYFGERCNVTSCFGIGQGNSSVCSSHGACIALDNCKCSNGYYGSQCEIISCFSIRKDSSSVCSGNGSCIGMDTCNCNSGYFGERCNITSCFGIRQDNSSVCSSNGKCVALDQCSCNRGYYGNQCEVISCFSTRQDNTGVCSGNGSCIGLDTCNCNSGYFGERCNITSCFGIRQDNISVCSSNGKCVALDNCKCNSGYYSDICNVTSCFGIREDNSSVCSSNGKCVALDQCSCNRGYYGNQCDIISCYSIRKDSLSVCSGNGSCIGMDTCQCNGGYFGERCNLTSCFGIRQDNSSVCSSHGACIALDNCKCSNGYYGNQCEVISCFSTRQDNTGVCSGNGSCIGMDTCNCNSGYFGERCNITSCFGIRQDNISVCSSNGRCNSFNNCSCYSGFYGEYCQFSPVLDTSKNTTTNGSILIQCFGKFANDSKVCSGRGLCLSQDNCTCNSSAVSIISGNVCQDMYCHATVDSFALTNSSIVCSSNGVCTTVGCTCNESYVGIACQDHEFTCYGVKKQNVSVCSGNGVCVSTNNCSCFDSFYGINCEFSVPGIIKCFGVPSTNPGVCSSHGNCIGNNNCSCLEGFTGGSCAESICYGINSSDSGVCSAQGFCSSPNKCDCKHGYTGLKCNIPICHNIFANETGVCSNSSGVCTSPNTCECKSGFYGNECEIPICYGKLANDSTVCNGLGVCSSPNNCECNSSSVLVKINGNQCQYLQCLGSENKFLYSTNTAVCNKKGSCGINGCQCITGYSGEYCQLYSCAGILFNQSDVCSGHGNCTDFDTCSCAQTTRDGFWRGGTCNICRGDYETEATGCKTPKCDNYTCNQHGFCDSNLTCVCTGNWSGKFCTTCKANYFGLDCGIFCEKYTSCSGHGDCSAGGDCSCYANARDGYWEGSKCNKCQSGYYGSQCSTQIIGPAKFLDMFNGIVFNVIGPVSYTQSKLDCSRLISSADLSVFGLIPVCSWTNRSSGEFTILFGDDYTLTPGSIVRMNRLAFDVSGSDLQDVNVLNADHPATPVVSFSGLNIIGTCDNFTLDASNSYSGDRKPLIYYWSVISSPNNFLSIALPNTSVLQIDYISLEYPGEYKFGLQVRSSISGMISSLRTWSVVKAGVPLPVISIIGLKEITINKYESPLVIKKSVELPYCFYANQELKIVWQQLSGPNTTSESDKFNNLAITHFHGVSEAIYEFKVTATSVFDPASSASDTIKITVRTSPLSLLVYADEVSSETGTIVVDLVDPESTLETEIWSWSCFDSTNNVGCGPGIENTLLLNENDRSSRFQISSSDLKVYGSIPTLKFTLSVSKGIRSIQSTIDFVFPESKKVPPTVSLISFLPSKSEILKQDMVNLQLAVTANGESIGIDQYITREWSLNSMVLKSTDAVLSSMAIDPTLTNSIVINPDSLEDGATYIVTLRVIDNRNGLSASYSHSFTIATPPQACPCTILPASGIALETTFSFKCINCQNAKNSLSVVYGFIDDKSGANIPLNQQGSTFSTKLPCSYAPLSNKILATYVRITDTSTGAYTEIRKNITMDLAPVKSVVEVKKKVASYSNIQNSLKDGDTAKMVFNSATISRVADGMLAKLTAGQRRYYKATCQNGGTFNSETKKCTCLPGYSKEDCSITTEDFAAYKEIRLSLITEFINSFEARNPYEIISETYLTLQAYGLDSLIEKYDEIDNYSFEKSYTIVNTLLKLCEYNKELRVPFGIDRLLTNILNSIYNYILYNDLEGTDHLVTLFNMLKRISSLMLRGLHIGEKDIHLQTKFASLSTNKLFRAGFESRITSPVDGSRVMLPLEMPYYLSEKSNRKSISFISILASDIFGLSTHLEKTKILSEDTTTIDSKIVSTVVSSNIYARSDVLFFELVEGTADNIQKPVLYQTNLFSVRNYSSNTLVSTDSNENIVTSIYRTSDLVCKTVKNFTLEDDPSCSILISSNTVATCKCNSTTNTLVVERIVQKVVKMSNPAPSIPIDTPQDQSFGIIIGVVVGAIWCLCLTSVVCIILAVLIRKRNRKNIPELVEDPRGIEMSNLTV